MGMCVCETLSCGLLGRQEMLPICDVQLTLEDYRFPVHYKMPCYTLCTHPVTPGIHVLQEGHHWDCSQCPAQGLV